MITFVFDYCLPDYVYHTQSVPYIEDSQNAKVSWLISERPEELFCEKRLLLDTNCIYGYELIIFNVPNILEDNISIWMILKMYSM